MTQQTNMTAVEWLFEELNIWQTIADEDTNATLDTVRKLLEQAIQIEKQNKIDFLIWLKENHWHVYKDGTWFTSKDHAYIYGKPRKFYTEEQLIEKYKEYGKESNND